MKYHYFQFDLRQNNSWSEIRSLLWGRIEWKKADYTELKAWRLHLGHDEGEKNEQNKTKQKWHQIFLLITNTRDIIAFSTVTRWQLGYKQMLMTYKQYNTQVF